MTLAALDRSPEAAHDECQRARLDFLATPCEATAETYRRRAFFAWKAINGSSVGWEAELEFLDGRIRKAIELHEMRTGRAAAE